MARRRTPSRLKRDHLPGGRAAHMDPRDFDSVALAEGTRHELEHTTNRDVAQEIAMDHLAENPHYYEMLAEMERRYPRANGEIESQYVEFPRHIAEQVKHLRPDLWRRHGTGGNPPTAWTGDNAYKAWQWWLALRTARRIPMSDVPVAQEAYTLLTNNDWHGDYGSLFRTVVELWLRKRENYVTRHSGDFQPGGTIAMIKWAAVFPWAEDEAPGMGYKRMLETLGLEDDDGIVKERSVGRPNGVWFKVT